MEKATKAHKALDAAYRTKNTAITEKVESILLPNDTQIVPAFKEFYDKIGNNPIEEPELYDIFKEGNVFAFKVALGKRFEFELKDHPAADVSNFYIAVVNKIENVTTDDGVYKVTEATKDAKLPNSEQANEIMEQDRTTPEGIERATELIYECSGLDVDTITDWEKTLIASLIFGYAIAGATAELTRQALDKTPFATYLKN